MAETTIALYQVDAFTSKTFGGNPAAICPLDRWLKDDLLQSIAAENNLSETAYYVRENGRYRLRWFTPAFEVDLCGHATLAAAHVILNIRRETAEKRVVFDSRSGELAVALEDDLYVLDFPSRLPVAKMDSPALFEALGARPMESLLTGDCFCVFETEDQVRALAPDMSKLASIDCRGTIATAPGKDCDFVSRFFAPRAGIPEDPVTGSAHTELTPYWSRRLGKKKLFARQISRRGGELWCEDRGDRVSIAGRAAAFMEGRITIPCEWV
ncbi:MAG TPA: PhzF family phenazine biosynthesis protein [Bryobacteraceae bacterium]|jgi:PhzF family phenazine biosynthesis protein